MRIALSIVFLFVLSIVYSQRQKPFLNEEMSFYTQAFNQIGEANIFIEFDQYQLLKKENPKTGKFEYVYKVEIDITHKKTQLHLDTISRTFRKEALENELQVFIDSFRIGRRSYDFQYEITLTDLNKNCFAFQEKSVTPSKNLSEIHFLKRKMDGTPIVSIFHQEASYLIQSNRYKDTIFSAYFFKKTGPAPPPFANKSSTLNFGSADSLGKLLFNIEGFAIVNSINKPLVLSGSELSSEDFWMTYQASELFPYFKNYEALIEPLKYFTSRDEFGAMMNADNKRKAFEDFWIKIAGDKVSAKKMIKAYYNRVLHSNKHFSSFKQGWKSDRGIMYIVFGEPEYTESTGNEIKWTYGSRFRGGSSTFIFYRSLNNLPNDFELVRNNLFKSQWYLAVENWRNGMVYQK